MIIGFFVYAASGRLTKDLNKKISGIQYNYLHLPKQIDFTDGRKIEYVYDASGVKLQTKHTKPGESPTTTDYFANRISEDGVLKMIRTEEGYAVPNGSNGFNRYYYIKDHLGNNRVVMNENGGVEQVTNYYPFGTTFAENPARTDQDVQRFKFGGKELDRMFGLDMYDFEARMYSPVLGRFMQPDPMAEKYYSVSPYAYCANNPIRYVDLRGDSLTLAGSNVQETIMAIYNGLENGTNVTMKFNNGVLNPSSIAQQAQNTSDLFLQDLFEIAVNPMMVELSTSDKNRYMLGGQKVEENFIAPYDYNTSEDPQAESLLKLWGEPIGRSIQGNLGQTLIPGNVSLSGKSSANNNVQVIINGKGSLNHRTVGIAHEFGHVILYLRKLPYGHGQSGVDPFVYGRSTRMSKKLGYDF